MCGIAGCWDMRGRMTEAELRGAVVGMTQRLRHRGPDSGAIWLDVAQGLALGHRRLAIRDLSERGSQPMVSPDGRLVLVYNGEIYNTAELAAELEESGLRPKGEADTEILLLALMAWGVEKTLTKLLGMFAFALWDRRAASLVLARDRFGVKPLYWTHGFGELLFASDPDAFYGAPHWRPEPDYDAVALYLRFGYIPAPYCVWKGVHKLPSAHYMKIDADGRRSFRYWDAMAVAQAGLDAPLALSDASEEKAVEALDQLLTDAVERRMVAHVPRGVFLSGGIDSSLVTALMQKCSSGPVKTFSIGFEEAAYNEAPHAAAVAAHLQTDHTEMYVSAKDAWNVVPQIADIYSEPFGDASALPTILLSRLARESVTTALSGDGGDELFAGYSRYAACLANASLMPPPGVWKRAQLRLIKCMSPVVWDRLAALLPPCLRPANAGVRLHNYADLGLDPTFAAHYQRYYMQYWWQPSLLLKKGKPPEACGDDMALSPLGRVKLAAMQLLDTRLYLADDILTKVDRASMSCSLEVRVPLLDQRVYAFAWRLPVDRRQKDGRGKYLLRRVLARYVPPDLVERPKMGFGIPLAEWLAGPLREWAEELLQSDSLRPGGVLRSAPIHKGWKALLAGKTGWEFHIWIVFMLLAWLKRRGPSCDAPADLPVVRG